MKSPTKFLVMLLALALLVPAAPADAQMLMNGAGATFPYPIYSKWFEEYIKVDPEVRFNYQSIGSGGGIRQITERTVDFGASDGPMTDEQLQKAPGPLLHIPTVLGAVVATYNLPGNPQLALHRAGPGRRLPGQDHEVERRADQGPQSVGVTLPDQPIVVVHRSDGSGHHLHLGRLPLARSARTGRRRWAGAPR